MKASISATETRGRGNTGKEMNKKKQKQLETHGQLKNYKNCTRNLQNQGITWLPNNPNWQEQEQQK